MKHAQAAHKPGNPSLHLFSQILIINWHSCCSFILKIDVTSQALPTTINDYYCHFLLLLLIIKYVLNYNSFLLTRINNSFIHSFIESQKMAIHGFAWLCNNVTTLLKRLFLEQMLITPTRGLVVFFTYNLIYSCRNIDWIISWTFLFLSLTWDWELSFEVSQSLKQKKLKKFKECWLFFWGKNEIH